MLVQKRTIYTKGRDRTTHLRVKHIKCVSVNEQGDRVGGDVLDPFEDTDALKERSTCVYTLAGELKRAHAFVMGTKTRR